LGNTRVREQPTQDITPRDAGPGIVAGAGPALAVQNLVKRFGAVAAVDDVSFDVPGGAFLSLLGPSGSGKTTVLRLLGGFETLDAGRILIDGSDIAPLPPHRRDIGVVFQRYALFPHMTVAENVGFSLKQRGVSADERRRRVDEMLEMVGLEGLGARAPGQLSGGQQQRVALARALVFKPRILLMDEPLAALDKRLRERLQQEIRALQRRLGITTVYVTHDQTEAFVMSDLVAVMNAGKIEQIAAPRLLYDSPKTAFVAQFVGDSNLFHGADQSSGTVRLRDGTVLRHGGTSQGGEVTLLVRPEKIHLDWSDARPETANILRGQVTDVMFLGDTLDYRIAAGGQTVVVRVQNRAGIAPYPPGTMVTLAWALADTVLL